MKNEENTPHFFKNHYSASSLNLKLNREIFKRSPEIVPKTTHIYTGPFFTSVSDAVSLAFWGFYFKNGKNIKDLCWGLGPYNLVMGTKSLVCSLVTPELLGNMHRYRWFSQICEQIGDSAKFLKRVKPEIDKLFTKIEPDGQYPLFTVFSFGKLICREFLAEKEKTLVFRFLEGFSLIKGNSGIRAELLQ